MPNDRLIEPLARAMWDVMHSETRSSVALAKAALAAIEAEGYVVIKKEDRELRYFGEIPL
jgi:hypothetical protein